MFVHLHVHDEYSILDGFGTTEDFVNQAIQYNQPYLAITNHGNIDNFYKLQAACKNKNIKPIYGVELYIVKDASIKEKGEKRNHITVLIQNETGYKNLMCILTKSHLDYFYYRPRVDPALLLQYKEGLIFLSACSASLIHQDWGVQFLTVIDKQNVFLEIMPHYYHEQQKTNELAFELSKKYGWKTVATNDCHYPKNGDEYTQEILLAIQTKAKWKDKKRFKFNCTGLFLKSEYAMIKSLVANFIAEDQAIEACNNTMLVADMCKDFDLPENEISIPKLYENSNYELSVLCEKEMYKFSENKIYVDRLKEELQQIKNKPGFADYILIVYDLISWCRNNDVMVGPGRGSSSSSLICFLLGITMVDPIKHDLLFSRFIAPSRIDLPDIDIDFEDRKRYLVVEHLIEKYGENYVAGVSTFSRLGCKGIFRDVCRVFEIPLNIVNIHAKMIDSELSLADNFDEEKNGYAKSLNKFKNKYKKQVSAMINAENTIRHKGQHAAGVIVSAENLHTSGKCYLTRASKNCKTGVDKLINWDKNELDTVGFIKLDILGLNGLSTLSEILRLIKLRHDKTVILDTIEFDDSSVLSAFSNHNGLGIHQFASSGMQDFCCDLRIESFKDVVAANALWRPGTLKTKMNIKYARRKNGIERTTYLHESIESITQDTYGIILYQEQVMQLVHEVAGLSWEKADEIRKVIAKSKGKEAFQKYKTEFANGCVETSNVKKDLAGSIWDLLESFGNYSFNKSHAVAYSVISYWQMYFKVYYPLEFYAATLSFCADDIKTELIREARKNNLQIRLPFVGISKPETWYIYDDKLYCPFSEIIGIGANIFSAKKKLDLFEDVKETLTSRDFDLLTNAGCFLNKVLTDETAFNVREYYKINWSK